MSIKIYPAYRTKAGANLFSLVESLRERVEKNVRKVLKEEMASLGGTPFEAYERIKTEFTKQHVRAERNHYGMDVSITFREQGQRYYVIPYANGMMQGVWKFLDRHKWLEDFHYQNSTDKSAACTDAEWEARKRIWESLGCNEVTSSSRWWDYVALEVLTPDSFFRVAYPLIYNKRGEGY